jgi:AraC family transcriptional regulator
MSAGRRKSLQRQHRGRGIPVALSAAMTAFGPQRTFTAAGITLHDHFYAPSTVLAAHGHDKAFLSLVLSGAYSTRSGGTETPYTPGLAVYHGAQHEHRVSVGNRAVRAMTVEISGALMQRLRDTGAREPAPLLHLRGSLAWLCGRVYEESLRWSPASPLVLEGLVLELLGGLGKADGPAGDAFEPRWLRRVEELVRSDLDRALTVERIAERVGVHPVHLSRTWRRFRGLSIGESVQRARIDQACRRIAAGSEPLADLALALGFADQSHFSRVFKRVTGMTPGAFRRQTRDQR